MTSSSAVTTLDDPAVLVSDAVVPADDACDVCAHPMSQHDAIARRYCTATFANASTHKCICSSK